MDKIRILFNEQDYQKYHNYCFRYYTVYDTTRKRSIRLFLELFEKDIFPVREDDLGEAMEFFSKKCDELLTNQNFPAESRSSGDHSRYQVCRDIQLLIEDFEKIYRLIEKSGIAPNYLLVMATFSKIIEDEKRAYLLKINERDKNKIERFAPAIADTIQERLGADAGWETALSELTRIVRKFNDAFPNQKIDRNCLSLIGPAVISHFNTGIGYDEIQSTLDKQLEDRDLAEFESILNNTVNLPDNDAGPDISDSAIFEVLKSISGSNIDTGYYEQVPDPDKVTTTTLPAVIPHSAGRNSGEIISYEQTSRRYPQKIIKNHPGRFDIDISDTERSLVIIPEQGEKPAVNLYTQPGIPQISVMVMGIVILILLAVTMAATAGLWSPVKSMDNNSGFGNNVSSQVILQQIAALQKNVTLLSVIQKSPPQLATNGSGSTVSDNKRVIVTAPTPKTTWTTADINKHFFQIAFGPDNTKIRKVGQERISISIMGDYEDKDADAIEQFISLFNNYSYTNKISSFIKSGDQSNIVVYFLPAASIKNIEPLDNMEISKDTKTGVIHYLHETVNKQYMTTEIIYINSDYHGDQRTHWMLRGLLYELGFPGETYDYPDSIFNAASENTTRLNEIDLKALELMYGKKMTAGLASDRVKAMLLL